MESRKQASRGRKTHNGESFMTEKQRFFVLLGILFASIALLVYLNHTALTALQ